ncbi:sulfite exporter TauE/SafE family protein [Psychromonas sp. KJ10-10]|uniref:sulfite exporter TauE/SafE family protein n=1 Tax=Psychromonas sp. KJ10-10 TaxID=3391823 RepID=UPI0039B61640
MEFSVIIAMAIIFVGAFIQTSVGFGMAIFAAPLLIHLSFDYVPVPIILVACFISILNTLHNRKSIEIGALKMAIIGRIPGSLIGALLLLYVSVSTLSLWLGILVLISLVISLLPFRLEPTPSRMTIAGFLSGFMGTSSGIGGPPIALLLQHQEASKLRGNLSAFFLFSSIISLIIQAAVGYLTINHFILTLPLLPVALGGYITGQISAKYLPQKILRYSTLILCLVAGFATIYEGI